MSTLRLLCVAISAVALAPTASAAGIQCAKAKSRAEKLICGDPSLVDADEALATTYKKTLEAAAAPDDLGKSQRAWLKQRDACTDAACLAAAYRARTDALAQVKRAEWVTYRNATLGISFEHLSNRKVKSPCPGSSEPTCVALVSRGMKKDEYLVSFELTEGELEAVASDKAGFEEQEGGKWMTTFGRFEPQPVERFEGKGWKGMRATVTCGVSDAATGFHAAAGECFWAVLGNGKRAAVVTTQGIVGTDADTMRSVSSFKFER